MEALMKLNAQSQAGGKILVAYFSASGVTSAVARTLAEAAGAGLYEITPATPYTKADLDWNNKNSRSSVEMRDPSFRPALADKDADIAACDVIFVGFPIWWYVAPTIINTFLESYDFSGKTIVPFATSGSSGLGKTAEKLKPSLSGTAIVKEGKLLNGKPSKNVLAEWIASLRL
jgi:flavodoxin